MLFEHVATGGCQSYLIGCADTLSAALIDPEIGQVERYKALAARAGLRIRYNRRHPYSCRSFLGRQAAGRDAGGADRHAPCQPGASCRAAARR
ncbi:MAG: hypothetical protein WDN69_10320 [Aliidongia sp.]